jgi:hypothetical protein
MGGGGGEGVEFPSTGNWFELMPCKMFHYVLMHHQYSKFTAGG